MSFSIGGINSVSYRLGRLAKCSLVGVFHMITSFGVVGIRKAPQNAVFGFCEAWINAYELRAEGAPTSSTESPCSQATTYVGAEEKGVPEEGCPSGRVGEMPGAIF
jgi:hypothetical protein